jgi:ribosomal protein L37E
MKEEIECERCGKKIIKRNPQHKYCTKCSSQINRENVKRRYQQNHK